MKKRSEVWVFVAWVILYGIVISIVRFYEYDIRAIIGSTGSLGVVLYVAMAALAVIIPLWSNIMLIPFGTAAWGAVASAAFIILGWWIGSVVSFAIGKTARPWLLRQFPKLARFDYVDRLISVHHPFASLVFLRMTFPVDVLSYALGMFSTKVGHAQNAITTLVGILPFAFVFAYIPRVDSMTSFLLLFVPALAFLTYAWIRLYSNVR